MRRRGLERALPCQSALQQANEESVQWMMSGESVHRCVDEHGAVRLLIVLELPAVRQRTQRSHLQDPELPQLHRTQARQESAEAEVGGESFHGRWDQHRELVAQRNWNDAFPVFAAHDGGSGRLRGAFRERPEHRPCHGQAGHLLFQRLPASSPGLVAQVREEEAAARLWRPPHLVRKLPDELVLVGARPLRLLRGHIHIVRATGSVRAVCRSLVQRPTLWQWPPQVGIHVLDEPRLSSHIHTEVDAVLRDVLHVALVLLIILVLELLLLRLLCLPAIVRHVVFPTGSRGVTDARLLQGPLLLALSLRSSVLLGRRLCGLFLGPRLLFCFLTRGLSRVPLSLGVGLVESHDDVRDETDSGLSACCYTAPEAAPLSLTFFVIVAVL